MIWWVSAVALLLDLLDLQRGVPGRRVGRQHPFEQGRAGHDPVGQGDEIVEELLFSGDQAESEHAEECVTRMLQPCYIGTVPHLAGSIADVK